MLQLFYKAVAAVIIIGAVPVWAVAAGGFRLVLRRAISFEEFCCQLNPRLAGLCLAAGLVELWILGSILLAPPY